MQGKASCNWQERVGRGDKRDFVNFWGEEKCLNVANYLFEAKKTENTEIQMGVHNYNFAYQLPLRIPYSIEGRFGHIRYKVLVNLEIPWALDWKAEKSFTVFGYQDLSLNSELRLPSEVEDMKNFCCLFCKSSPLIIKACLPKSGYALGERIAVTIELNNRSTTNVSHTTIALQRIDKFIANKPYENSREVKEKILQVRARGVNGGESVIFAEIMEIPHILLISDEHCKIYKISYELEITAKTKGVSMSLTVNVPLTIGSVGIQTEGYQQVAPYSASKIDLCK